MKRPDTRYAWNGDVSLAYQLVGEADADLLYLQGYCSNVDMNWESRHLAHFLRGLARHARLIVTDRRGWGCSERFTPGSVPDVDALTDDILAVLTAVDAQRASILATYESAIVASLFAAVYPERVRSLILVDPQVTYLPTDETPWMPSLSRWRQQIDDTLGRAHVKTPETKWMQRGGRIGRHTEHLGHMLAEMQVLQRQHPGASW